MTHVRWFGYTVYLLLGWTSVLVPALILDIEAAFRRTDAAIGLVYLLGALLHAVGALGGGVLADRIGARPMLTAALLIVAAGLLVQGGSSVWLVFVVAAAVGQAGFGAANGGIQALFLEVFPGERGGALNRLHLFFALGSLLGPAAVGLADDSGLSWRLVFGASGGVAILLAGSILTLPSAVRRSPVVAASSDEPFQATEQSLRPFLWLAVSIACYEAAALGVTSWLVRFLSDEPMRVATGALSAFWAGVCAIRLIAPWLTARFEAAPFTLACIVGSSVAVAAAVLLPWIPVAVLLFAAAGVFVGPIYPLLIAIGGDLYPRRLAALSGGLTTAATLGAIIYPPLMGVVANGVGIRVGLLGVAALGVPAAIALIAATRARPR
jgi:FHS family glucose/mannose:H+ symporter-like MFS transporter